MKCILATPKCSELILQGSHTEFLQLFSLSRSQLLRNKELKNVKKPSKLAEIVTQPLKKLLEEGNGQ